MVFSKPEEIEKESMRIIEEELEKRNLSFSEDELPVVKRVIHTTADFDFAENMVFFGDAVSRGMAAIKEGVTVITDTNMTLAGISKKALREFGCEARCYVADKDVAERAAGGQTTRAVCAVRKAVEQDAGCIYAVGNAPTALFELAAQINQGFRPALIIAVPVGFVNVVESKKAILTVCKEHDIPCIAAMGRKGGSTVSCAIINALLYKNRKL